ncbi:hypothetical protein ACHAXA_007650 [Cyclostephanos tholiformis]|uniref:Uncharacterized protein n=1 Tax=Cyclostephanos tholiformis TaxID=382380 RepID=A0ABD3SDE0_9STRA
MPKATKVGKFRAASRASSRDVRAAPLTSSSPSSSHQRGTKEKDDAATIKPATSSVDNATAGGANHRATTTTNDDASSSTYGRHVDDVVTLSRGQRKRLAKREQYLKRESMIMSSLRLRRLGGQVGKLDGLDAIREALCDASSSSSSSSGTTKKKNAPLHPTSSSCNTNRSRRALANAEISHMGLVLKHPAFNDDPFAAIRQHLRNSLVDDAEKLRATSKARDEEDGASCIKKKEERKERLREAKFKAKFANKKGRGSAFKSRRRINR